MGVGCQERPYHVDRTTSRPLCEVKRRRAGLVLRWGTTWEAPVLFLFLFSPIYPPSFFSPPQRYHGGDHVVKLLFLHSPTSPPLSFRQTTCLTSPQRVTNHFLLPRHRPTNQFTPALVLSKRAGQWSSCQEPWISRRTFCLAYEDTTTSQALTAHARPTAASRSVKGVYKVCSAGFGRSGVRAFGRSGGWLPKPSVLCTSVRFG
jgi:hypothetical protein